MSTQDCQEQARRTLVVCAVHAEASAVAKGLGFEGTLPATPWNPCEASPGFDLVISGVGKANAAGATARALASSTYAGVIGAGIAGSLPGSGLAAGATVLANASVFADEGVRTPEGFLTIGDAGFPVTDGIDGSVAGGESILTTLHLPEPMVADVTASGIIATVSTCSGTDARARDVATRTGAVCEAMEGAAVALVCARLGVRCAEVRAVSNNTGDRAGQVWDVPAALDALVSLFRAAR